MVRPYICALEARGASSESGGAMTFQGALRRLGLTPELDPHSGTFLGRTVLGMPAPVWSLAGFAMAMAIVMGLNAASLARGVDMAFPRSALAAIWLSIALLLLFVNRRARPWMLHAVLDLAVLVLLVTGLTAPSPLRSMTQLIFAIPLALYAATWFPRGQMAAHLLLLVLVGGVVVHHINDGRERIGFIVPWWAVLLLSAYFVNALVFHINRQALVDPLTGLLNRSGLMIALESSLPPIPERPHIIAVIDLDGFKEINDTQGHAAGDEVLRQVASDLRAHVRPSDVVARLGGDEFVVVFRRTDADRGDRIAERTADGVSAECSVGSAVWAEPAGFAAALAAADAAMYENKIARRS